MSDSVFIEIDTVVLIQIGDGRNFLSVVLVKISKYLTVRSLCGTFPNSEFSMQQCLYNINEVLHNINEIVYINLSRSV